MNKVIHGHGNEEWKDISGYEGFYEVSNNGRVKRKTSGRLLKPILGNTGYFNVVLSVSSNVKHLRINRLVAMMFIDNPKNKRCVNHKDGNKLNNNVNNLEWCTYSENELHAHRVLGKKPTRYWLGHKGGMMPHAKPVMCLNDGMVFPSSVEAATHYNLLHSYIRQIARGKIKGLKGFRFKYISKTNQS